MNLTAQSIISLLTIAANAIDDECQDEHRIYMGMGPNNKGMINLHASVKYDTLRERFLTMQSAIQLIKQVYGEQPTNAKEQWKKPVYWLGEPA